MKKISLAPWMSISAFQLFGIGNLGTINIHWPKEYKSKDFLTGIPNRQVYDEAITLAIKECSKQNAGFGLIVLDLDKFKSINDRYGHLIGDEVLKEFTRRLLKSIRNEEFFARYGGEEFVILTSCHERTFEIGERVRQTVFSSPFLLSNLELNVTCSFGCSVYPTNGLNAQEVFKSADDALYKAKANGRNQGFSVDNK